jgi:hypothetical protein
MMEHLQKSLTDLSGYLDRVSGSAYEVPSNALHGDLNMADLSAMHNAHSAMKS